MIVRALQSAVDMVHTVVVDIVIAGIVEVVAVVELAAGTAEFAVQAVVVDIVVVETVAAAAEKPDYESLSLG